MRTLLKYTRYIKPYMPYLVLAIVLMWFISIFSLAFPFLSKLVIDDVIINRNTSLLVWIFLGMIGTNLIVGIISTLRNYVLSYIGNKIDLTLRFDFIDHILHLPSQFFDEKKIGEIQSRIGDSQVIQTAISSIFLELGTSSISLFVYIIVLFMINVQLAFAVSLTIPFYIIISVIFAAYFRKKSQISWDKSSKINSEMYEILAGVKTIKTFAMEKRFTRKLKFFVMDSLRLGMEMNVVGSLQGFLTDFAGAIGTFLVFFVGTYQVLQNHMTIGGLIAFMAIMPGIFSPLYTLVHMNSRLQEAFKATERFDSVWSVKEEGDDFREPHGRNADRDNIRIRGGIRLEDVSYAYREDHFVLHDIRLDIREGETIALVGKSGSGKTTLTNLIPGFYLPQKGRVLIDDRPIQEYNLRQLRRQIGIVQQEPFLFSGTIRENITLGLPYYSDEEIERAAREANAMEFIEGMARGMSTVVGERGVSLSVGQKQRITIARVLLINPAILILDEPTSALDLESENMIQEALKKVFVGRTTLIIAHRLSTIRDADRILMLDGGKIVETGSHDSLMRENGHYASLYHLMGRL